MNELSPAARELVDAHRTDRTLTPADRKRIKHDLMLRVAALGATTAVAAEVAGMATTKVAATAAAKVAGMSLAAKVAMVALGVTAVTGVVSVSVWALRARAHSDGASSATSLRTMTDVVGPAPGLAEAPKAPPTPAPTVAAPARELAAAPELAAPASVPAASPAAVAAPARALARIPAATPRVAGVAAPGALDRRPAEVVAVPAGAAAIDSKQRDQVKTVNQPRETPAPAAAPGVAPDPEPELRALREARDDLRAGRPASAYRRLDDFDRQRGGGMLAQERSALSAIALCQWQPGAQARARAAEFLRRSPESPLAIRVRSACAQSSKSSP